MRILWFISLILLPCSLMADDVCPIAGTVLNLLTDQPVDRVTLRLAGTQNSYSVTTDDRGGFTLPRVAPGRYRLDAKRTGFASAVTVPSNRSGSPGVLLLDPPCAGLKDLAFRIAPNAVLTGRVFDGDGHPVGGARLSVNEPRDFRGTKILIPVANTSSSNLGDFQFVGLSPGRYFLVAIAPSPKVGQSELAENYVDTFYPGTDDVAAASAVVLTPGGRLNANIRLVRALTVPLNGTVVTTALSAANVNMAGASTVVSLTPRNTAGYHVPAQSHTQSIGQNSKFEFAGVASGSYDLLAKTTVDGKIYSSRQLVTVGKKPINDLRIAIGPGSTLRGRLRMTQNEDSAIAYNKLKVSVQPKDPVTAFTGSVTQVLSDGSFELLNVNPDIYDIQVSALGPSYYVDSILADGGDLLLSGLDLTSGSNGYLDIILSKGGSMVSGVVSNDGQAPVSGARVLLVPNSTDRRKSAVFFLRSTANPSGKFQFWGLAPGDYKLFAWQSLDNLPYLDEAFLRSIEDQGKSIRLEKNSQQQLTLRPID